MITRILIGAFRAVIASTPADLLPMIYLCTNRVAPAHVGLELGIGDATLIKVCCGGEQVGGCCTWQSGQDSEVACMSPRFSLRG